MIETCSIDSLSIHETANYSLTGFSMGSPGPRTVTANRPTDDGATDATRFYGPRPFEVTGEIWAPTLAEFWAAVDALKGALSLRSTHVLTFRRDGLAYDERAVVRIDGPFDLPLQNGIPFATFGFSLFARDPRIYTATLNTGSYDPTDAGSGGLTFPLTFPLDFQADETAGTLSVQNEGNIETPPVFVITGPVTNPIIDNDTTALSIYTKNCALSAGDTLTIDVSARSVILNGTTSRPDLINGALTDWVYIEPGFNQLRLRGLSMASTQTELSVAFRSARI